MANDGASGADRSDNSKSADRGSKSERAERDVSEASRETLSGSETAVKERDATPEERARGQERMAAEGQAAKSRVEREATARETKATPTRPDVTLTTEVAPDAAPPELGQLPDGTLAPSLREQMVAEAGGAASLDPPQQKEIDDFLASPAGIEAARQYDFARGLEVSELSEAQSMEAMRHFTAGRDVAYDEAGRIQLDDYGNVQTAEPIRVADSSGATPLDPRTNAEVAVEYARGLNSTVEAIATSNFAWAAGLALEGVALAAGGPVRFAISRATGLAIGAAAQRTIEWAAGLIAPRTGLSESDVAELAIAGGTVLGFAAGAITWRSIRRDLFNDLGALRHNTIDRVRNARAAALDEFRGREITAADLTNGTLAGHRNAGPGTRHFEGWLRNPDRSLEVTADGLFRYSVRITDPNSPLNGQTVGVTFDQYGVPDFAAYSMGRVDIAVDANRTGSNASLRTTDSERATAALWEAIEAGRIDRSRFTNAQLAAIEDGSAQIPDLTWHHDGQSLNQDGTGPMMLLPTEVHSPFGHWGWFSTARE